MRSIIVVLQAVLVVACGDDSSSALDGAVVTGTDALGVMCDGTWVLGCKELDGANADETDMDAQNGHEHAVVGLGTRYHVRICSTFTTHTRPYTPEIQFFSTCNVR